MRTAHFEVLSPNEITRIHEASMAVLATVGVKVEFEMARYLFRQAGAKVDDEKNVVSLSEDLVRQYVAQAPKQFSLHGVNSDFRMQVGGDNVQFAGLGTPTNIIDPQTGKIRPSTFEDMSRHIRLIDGCKFIHNSQMDVWPNDIPMTTIHTAAILEWARSSRKSFGMGCYGYLPTLDMMQMASLLVGGKASLREKPPFMMICSVMSPLQMEKMQLEGMFIAAEYGQPLAISPEAIAGATAPATLAGLLVQHNANILAHITLAQIYRPGTPVLYGTVSTVANMRHGTVALGSVETGLITAASAQLARHYGLPCRSVGAATDSKLEDVQAGIERVQTLLPAVLSGVNLITCGGTLDSTMLESEAMLMLDDELCEAMLRMGRGIEVNENTLALNLIKEIGHWGNYLAEEHTARNYRKEYFIPSLMVRDPIESWQEKGSLSALDYARQKVEKVLASHKPVNLDPALETALVAYHEKGLERSVEFFYAHEEPEYQDWEGLKAL